MGSFANLSRKVGAVNVNQILQKEITENSELIADLPKSRLEEYGTYADGTKIKTYGAASIGSQVYSPYTVLIKQEKGQPTDRVTLKDTGEFYSSFKVKAESRSFLITGDSEKPDGDISDNVDMLGVLDLSDAEKSELVFNLIPQVAADVKEEIL